MVTQVDQLVGGPDGEVALGHGAGEATDAFGQRRLARRAGHQPNLGARALTGAHCRLDHREGDDEIPEAERHRRDESTTYNVHDMVYSVVSGMPSSLKAS